MTEKTEKMENNGENLEHVTVDISLNIEDLVTEYLEKLFQMMLQ